MISKEAFLFALEEVDNTVLASLPEPEECSFLFSKHFERRMRAIIRHGKHPVMYQAFQRVACILLILLMLFSGVMIFSTDVRAAVMGWIKEQYDTFYHYFFPEETASVKQVEYTLGWVPEDYTFVDSFESEAGSKMIYVDSQSQILQFSYSYGSATTSLFADGEDYEYHRVQIGSNPADLYLSTSDSVSSGIVWIDSEENVLFCISAIADREELMLLAEKIIKIEA